MKVDDMFPRRYTSGADLNGPTLITVAKLTQEQLHPRPNAAAEEKWVLHTRELSHPVILTRALALGISLVLGPDTDHWTGRKVTLVPVPMTVAQKQVIAIRATGPTAAPAPAAAPQPANGHTGEIHGPAPVARYADGSVVGAALAEQQAYAAYIKAQSKAPANIEVLREWVRATPDRK